MCRAVEDLNYTITQPDLIGIHRTLKPTMTEYSLFSSVH